MSARSVCRPHFCPECQNVMNPVEDRVLRKLKYVCRICDSVEVATSSVVYRNDIKFNQDYRFNTTVWKEYAEDSTMPCYRGAECPKCGANEAVVQSDFGSRFATMKMHFICKNRRCGNRWPVPNRVQGVI